MDWRELGAKLIKVGAPAAGTILGGPIGGTIGGIVGNVIAAELGVEATPDAISTAIDTMPAGQVAAALSAADQKIVAQYGYLTELAKAQADVGKVQVEAVNETIRAEAQAGAAGGDGWWGKWRAVHAIELTAECPFWAGIIMYAIVSGSGMATNLATASGLVMAWWGARFGVLGVHVWQGSNERQAAITGVPAQVATAVAKVVRGK